MSTLMRVCSQCQMPLAASESACRNCGTSYIGPVMTGVTQFAFTAFPNAVVADESSQESTRQATSAPLVGIAPYDTMFDEAAGQNDAPSPLAATSTIAPTSPPRKGPRVALILGVLVLIVALAGSSFIFLIQARGSTVTSMPGIGVPVVSGNWEVTLKQAHLETELSGMNLGISSSTYTPKSGYTFLVLEVKLRSLDSAQQTHVSTDMFAIINSAGQIATPDLVTLDAIPGYNPGVAFITSSSKELNLGLAFVITEESTGHVYKLQFRNVALISFSAH